MKLYIIINFEKYIQPGHARGTHLYNNKNHFIVVIQLDVLTVCTKYNVHSI